MKTKTTAMWAVVLGILFAQLPFNSTAQNVQTNNFEVTHKSENGLAKNIIFSNPTTKTLSPSAGQGYLLEKLNLSSPYNLRLIKQTTDKLGMVHYRYRLTYNNYPVENTMYLLHTKQGIPVSANGDYVNNINLIKGKIITEDKAVEAAYRAENVPYNANTKGFLKTNHKKAAEMVIIHHKATQSYKLVYTVNVVAGVGHQHKIAIDALNGNVVRKENTFKCSKIHTIFSGEQQVTTLDSIGKHYLVDKVRGIKTYDVKGASLQGEQPWGAELVENISDIWEKEDFSTGALDAHFAATATYDYFLNTHNHKSFDGEGSPINSYVNVDIGASPNALWGGFMIISKPIDGVLLSTLDIVAHEISHGVSNITAEFGGSGETGALGEAYSDMFGALVEKQVYTNYPDSLNYQLGEQFSDFGRDFINPERFDNPRYYKGKNWDATNGDVHKNSNLHSHWMYLVAEGDANYTNEKNETYTINGIGREKVGDILFRALTVYLTSNSGYYESMIFTIQAAKDLYGPCSDEVAIVKRVWKAMGLNADDDVLANAEFSFVKSRCKNPVEFSFVNTKGSNKSYSWDFGDGTTSTDVIPTKTYGASGKYSVKLDVVGCTNDSKSYTLEIEVDNEAKCNNTIMPVNSTRYVESCMGRIRSKTDNTGTYYANNTAQTTIRNTNNSPYMFEFVNFEVGYNTDRVEVYDGIGTNGTKIGEFSVQAPPSGKYLSTTGAITFKEVTDEFSDYDGGGFEVYYECDKKTTTTSVAEVAEQNIKIWPNPASNKLNIYYAKGIKSYRIMDVSGKLIAEAQVGASSTSINLDSYTSGLYLVSIITETSTITEKIIVQ